MKVLGLCLGASTVSLVQLENKKSGRAPDGSIVRNPRIVYHAQHPHEGNPKRTLINALKQIDVGEVDKIAATGRRFRNFVNLSSISEPEAVEYAYKFVKPPDVTCPAVVSAGGETFMVYVLDRFGKIANVRTGNKCASGTGEFFLQQLRRMNVTLEEAARYSITEDPYFVSGRCSVFCKSDCTHATNKGVPREKVTAGLCKMMADKILELLERVEKRRIMIIGGTTKNQMMTGYLEKKIEDLIIPEQAPYFEALGAALWAFDHETLPYPGDEGLFKSEMSSFDRLPPLREFENMVEFKTIDKGTARSGDACILGLDVGSTTTKAVLMRTADDAMLASIYLRTNGDPVGASRRCYQAIADQVRAAADPADLTVNGLGVCGSGRQIAGLHALTDGVINEIIAHAAAAVYFDPKVDTIFEIGGQDAKYTYITNAVASDYAMNEACSAGTGSFLEESAFETLGVAMTDIADIALKGASPPNFNDQCAAFIASDIKNAIHEGVAHEDIVAGLVYSICMNYANRVKGNRPVGEMVYMQGGVCYNRAVPLAMASLTGKPIVVPPEPGLMGAYGVALEVKKRMAAGLMAPQRFDLQELADRDVAYGKPFICRGGKEKCDRRCRIARIVVEGKTHPFGGACNRYYNLRHNIKYDVADLDLVRIRQRLIFETFAGRLPERCQDRVRGRIGINRSFLVNTYYPLYSTFFSELGFEIVVPDAPTQEGINQRSAPFCYPVELAHGFFHSLLRDEKSLDYIFLPHFKAVPVQDGHSASQVCPFVQGEPFYLRTTFRKRLEALMEKGTSVLTPLLDFTQGLEEARRPLTRMAADMGVDRKAAERAFSKACRRQRDCLAEMRRIGREALAELEKTPERSAAVVFARPYNGFVEEAHMGIPHKFASRGVKVFPLDFLPLDGEKSKRHMYWGMGQLIIKAAKFVRKHPQLFGTYITNFSCGPDSFIVGYVRQLMGQKPSLTLELDSHTADAGLETRIEAFIDIVTAYRQLTAERKIPVRENDFTPARARLLNGVPRVVTSSGQALPLTHPRVTFLIPSMGRLSSEALAAVFRSVGFNAVAHPPSDDAVLKLGRANTSCKECLPLILTTGSLLNYINNGKRDDEVLVYFMATASGPCRFGQYFVFMEDLVERLQIPDVALFSLTSENAYAGLGNGFHRRAWWGFVIADVMEDIRSMLLANAADVDQAMGAFEAEFKALLSDLESRDLPAIEARLAAAARRLADIPLKRPVEEVPVVLIAGEIFVRRDALSRQNLTEKLAGMGFASVCAPVSEWLLYADYLVDKGLVDHKMSFMERLKFMLKKRSMIGDEKRIKSILAASGLVTAEPLNVNAVIDNAAPYISPNLTGEAVLTVGSAITEAATHACGVIAIGPFGCMPNRLSEAILNETMNKEAKLATDPGNADLRAVLGNVEDLPFLAIESDGSPFPQLINAKLETFCLRAERLHREMRRHQGPGA